MGGVFIMLPAAFLLANHKQNGEIKLQYWK